MALTHYIFRDMFEGEAGYLVDHTPDVGKPYHWPKRGVADWSGASDFTRIDGNGYATNVTGTIPGSIGMAGGSGLYGVYQTISRVAHTPGAVQMKFKIEGDPTSWGGTRRECYWYQRSFGYDGGHWGIRVRQQSTNSSSFDIEFWYIDPYFPIHTETLVLDDQDHVDALISVEDTIVKCFVNGTEVYSMFNGVTLGESGNCEFAVWYNNDNGGIYVDEIALLTSPNNADAPMWRPVPKGYVPCGGYVRLAVWGTTGWNGEGDGPTHDYVPPPDFASDYYGDPAIIFNNLVSVYLNYGFGVSLRICDIVYPTMAEMEDPNYFADNLITAFLYDRQNIRLGFGPPALTEDAVTNIKNYFTGNYCLMPTDVWDGGINFSARPNEFIFATKTGRWCNNKGYIGASVGAFCAMKDLYISSAWDLPNPPVVVPLDILGLEEEEEEEDGPPKGNDLYVADPVNNTEKTGTVTSAGENHYLTNHSSSILFEFQSVEFIYKLENIPEELILVKGPSSYTEPNQVTGNPMPVNMPWVIANPFIGEVDSCPYFLEGDWEIDDGDGDGGGGGGENLVPYTVYYVNKDPTQVSYVAEYITEMNDLDSNNWKHIKYVDMIGDYGDNNISLAWTKDPAYNTWSSYFSKTPTDPSTIQATRFYNLGQGRRFAFDTKFVGNSDISHEAIEVKYNIRTQ